MKKISRRQFLKGSLTAGAMIAAGGTGALWRPKKAYAFAQSPSLRKFISPLRGIGGSGIPVAAKDAGTQSWWQPGVEHYSIDIGQFEDQLHPSLANPTRLWGYGQGWTQGSTTWSRHLGGLVTAKRGTPTQITFTNHLPDQHIVPVDTSSFFPTASFVNRAAVHLHGHFVPWISDGGPFDWFDPNGTVGPSFKNNEVLNPGALPGQAEYYYPNNMSARFMWYHDHFFDNTRLNAYAGLATGYVLTDDYETELTGAPYYLPAPFDTPNLNPKGRTIYMVFEDKIFFTGANDPSYPVTGARSGDLWYAHTYDPNRWTVGPTNLPMPDPSVIPEFFGDTIVVNGQAFPYMEVEQRQYRFRMLNACNARFLRPKLVYAQSNNLSSTGSAEPNASRPGPAFIQIANEGGFLPHPAMLNGAGQTRLLLAPAERCDLIVDFRNVAPGSVLILYGDAPAPFPTGDSVNDYSPTNFLTPSSKPGFGPNTRTFVQIRVKARVGAANPPISLPATFTPTDPFLITQTPGVPTPIPAGVPVRQLTLNEDFDQWGRLIQFLGTNVATGPGPVFGRFFSDPPTEIIDAGTDEVWEIANLTGDTHPIHFHLVDFQILSRQPFDVVNYNGTPVYTGPAIAPDANELGWKETIRMNPGQVIRIYTRFNLTQNLPFTVPTSTRFGTPPAGKKYHEYVWHCHILEHEEHDMMRPMIVQENIPV